MMRNAGGGVADSSTGGVSGVSFSHHCGVRSPQFFRRCRVAIHHGSSCRKKKTPVMNVPVHSTLNRIPAAMCTCRVLDSREQHDNKQHSRRHRKRQVHRHRLIHVRCW